MSATNARNSPSLLPRLLFDKICAITTAKTDTANDSRRPPPPLRLHTPYRLSRLSKVYLTYGTKRLSTCARRPHPSIIHTKETRGTASVSAPDAIFTRREPLGKPRGTTGEASGGRLGQPTHQPQHVLVWHHTNELVVPPPYYRPVVLLLVLRVALVDLRIQICERVGLLHPLVSRGRGRDTGGVRVWEGEGRGRRFRRDRT